MSFGYPKFENSKFNVTTKIYILTLDFKKLILKE